jgi:hypothetical protein
MREREMRQRVESFLQTRLRKMLAPATIGLGLAMTACPTSGLDSNDDGGALVSKDSGADQGPVLKYMAPIPPDAGATAVYMAQMPDAGPEAPAPQPDYMAPIPRDAGTEALMPQPEYMAQMPDARLDTSPVLRYMAQMPDAAPDLGRNVALYMAPLPTSRS